MGFHILVLAGGSGTRLWPVSRQAIPKHLLPLGHNDNTLLHDTVERVMHLGARVHIVTAADQEEMCRDAVADLGLGEDAVIAEPEARGTGPALGLATLWIARNDPEAIIASVHADHHIDNVGRYRAALWASAGWAASTGGLATVGIVPTWGAPGLGYIEVSEARDNEHWSPPPSDDGDPYLDDAARTLHAHDAAGFHEKPPKELAERFYQGGKHLWNLGLFAWPVTTFVEELRQADPELHKGLRAVVAARISADEALATRIYSDLRNVAVEPLIFERTSQLTVVSANFSWSDVGSWSDFWSIKHSEGGADSHGNVIEGDGLVADSHDCLVVSRGGRLVAVAGARDIAVIDVGDAILVVPKSESQSVKTLVDELRVHHRKEI